MNRMIITSQMIEDGISKNGGWSNKQILLLGFGRHKGWRRRAIGKEILTERYTEFLALKDIHLKNKNKYKSSTLDGAIKFIIDNFTKEGEFKCPHLDCHSMECDNCDTQKQYWEIIKSSN